jgi:PAS domain S-box-containing protein
MDEHLRQRAEQLARTDQVTLLASLTPEAAIALLYELQVHQIELELQNEELRQTQEQLDLARARYFDLYDLAPVGYVSLNNKGLIQEANLSAATLLGQVRNALIQQPLSRFIAAECQDSYYQHQQQLRKSAQPQAYEVRLTRPGAPLWVQLNMALADAPTGAAQCRVTLTDISARKRAEEALHESEQRFRAVAELSPDGILVNQGGRIVYANPAAAHIYGLADPAEMVGLDAIDVVAPEQRARARARIEQTLADISVPWIETDLLRPDGTRVSVDVTAAPITWDGTPAVEAFWRESARRRAHAATMERIEALFRAVQESAADGLLLFESVRDAGTILDFRCLYANAAAEQIVGKPRGWTPGRLMLQELPQNIRSGLFTACVRVVEAGEPWSTETTYHYDQIEGYVRLTAAKVEDGIAILLTDLTERRLAEQRLRESEQRFRTITELSPDGVLVYQNRRLVYANPAAAQICGLADPAQLIECEPADVVAPEHLESVYAWIDQVLAGQHLVGAEVDFVHPGGARVTIDCSAARILWGGAPAIEILWHDVTARRASEVQVRAALAAEQAARLAAEVASARTLRLQALTADLVGALSPDAVITVITQHALAATGAIGAVMLSLNPDNDQLSTVSWAGFEPHERAVIEQLLNRVPPALIATVAAGEAVWLHTRAEAEARFPGLSQPMAQAGYEAHVTMPLISDGHVLGALSLCYRTPQEFPAEERTFLLALAQQCAQALDRARFHAEVLQSRERLRHLSERLIAVQEEERRHLARELHDEIGQTLSALSLMLNSGSAQAPEPLAVQLVAAQRQVAGLIAQIRQRSLDLRPAMLDDMGLRAVLGWYLNRYQEQTGIRLEVEIQGLGKRFAPPVELAAYRIIQEALTNVVRHAGVDHATVLAWVGDDQLMIEVSDAGRGFDVEATHRTHMSNGLSGMTERVALLGGEFQIESEPGEGTRLFVALPLGRSAAAREES